MQRCILACLVVLLAACGASKRQDSAQGCKPLWSSLNDGTIQVRVFPPQGWCKVDKESKDSIDYYREGESEPTFQSVVIAPFSGPYEVALATELKRLQGLDEGGISANLTPIDLKVKPPCNAYQLEGPGEGPHCLVCYRNYKSRYVIKVIICNMGRPLSTQLKTDFLTFLKNTVVELKDKDAP
jgi:hypothetical protein